MKIIDYTRGYKQISGIRRIPIALNVDPRTGDESIVLGLEDIQAKGLVIRGKPYMSTEEMYDLFSDEIVIEEKVDGHPVVILHEGYTFFCESLSIMHTVAYDNCPYSTCGWPDHVVTYEIMEGEVEPPYTYGQGRGKWLTRLEKEMVCDMVGSPIVPLVYKGRVRPYKVPHLADRLSSFGSSTSEGIVLKNLKKGIFGKFINIEFHEKISDESLQGGVHPMMKGIRNIRRR